MKNLAKNGLLISILVMIGAFGVVHYLLVAKHREQIILKNQLTSEITAKDARLEKIRELKPPLSKLEQSVNLLMSVGLPRGDSIPDLIEHIEQLMLSQSDFKLVSFIPSLSATKTGTSESGLIETPFSLVLKGDASKVSSVLDVLYKSIRPVSIKTLALSPNSIEGAPANEVTVTMSLVAYSQINQKIEDGR